MYFIISVCFIEFIFYFKDVYIYSLFLKYALLLRLQSLIIFGTNIVL